MRAWTRRALTLSAACGATLLWAGCQAKKQTEYVTGISTQVQVPRDLKAVRVDVNVGGAPAHCRAYPVFDGRVKLPRSLGQLPTENADLGNPITVTIVGFTEDVNDPARGLEYDCTKKIVAGDNARILRRSRQPYVKDRILFLPMALRYSCFDKDCGEESGKTCKAGRCVDAATDEKTLPTYSDELLDGTGGACFRAKDCFAAAVPPAVVNEDDCTYALPNTPSAPSVAAGLPPNPFPKGGDGVNVRVVYDGGLNSEILDKDPDEGFLIPDASKPQQFRLSGGLCDLVKGYDQDGAAVKHRITGIFASGTCQAKGPFQPLCREDLLASMGADAQGVSRTANAPSRCVATALKPPTAALLVLADGTAHSKNFNDDAAGADISLSDPAFEKTDLGLMFFPGAAACNGGSGSFPLAVEPENARKARDKLVTAFTARYAGLAGSTDFVLPKADMDGALSAAYALLRTKYPRAYKRAVLLLANHDFKTATCRGDSPAVLANGALTNATSVETYVAILTADPDPAQAPKEANDEVFKTARDLASAGSDPLAPRSVYDARFSKGPAQQAFRAIVNELATCVYNAPPPPAAPEDTPQFLTYTDPVTGETRRILRADGCTSVKSTVAGWGTDETGRVIVCDAACRDYRSALERAAAYSGQYLKPALAVPMFAHAAGCAPEAGGKPSGP